MEEKLNQLKAISAEISDLAYATSISGMGSAG